MGNKSIQIRPAHFSHFSREREMILRDISREKCGARNCEKIWPIFGNFRAQFVRNLDNFLAKKTPIQIETIYQLPSHSFFNIHNHMSMCQNILIIDKYLHLTENFKKILRYEWYITGSNFVSEIVQIFVK